MKRTFSVLLFVCILASLLLLSSCSASFSDAIGSLGGGYKDSAPDMDMSYGESYAPSDGSEGDYSDGATGDETSPELPNNAPVKLPAGMMTAGAWNDNTYYSDWAAHIAKNGKFQGYYDDVELTWGFNSSDRVKVTVRNGEGPVAGATVEAYDDDSKPAFRAVTDAEGNAYLFPSLKSGTIAVYNGEEKATAAFDEQTRVLEVELATESEKLNVVEIMLVVDVTGSMSDELYFLKAELADVINRIAANDSETVINLAMLFYRDHGDKVPFDYYDFTDVTNAEGLAKQQAALDKQSATGGGDYPEAVDEALEMAVNKQWSTGATTKIIFHVLDAPAHDDKTNKAKLTESVEKAAELGIRICPIICSGAAESTEYTMREAAVYTGGTFIFVTDDSGIGGGHHDPNLPNATVELLNSLMVRLVKGYHSGTFDEPIYWRQDPNLGSAN